MVFLKLLYKLIFIGVEFIYNVVLVSGVQQSESFTQIHNIHSFLDSFPYTSLHVLSRVLCAIQYVLFIDFYI